MPLELVPLNNRVLIEPIERSNAFGLLLPETSKEKPQEGIVLRVGPGRFDKNDNFIPTTLEPGMRVLMAKYASTDIKLNGKNLLLVTEDDVLGVLVGTDDGTTSPITAGDTAVTSHVGL